MIDIIDYALSFEFITSVYIPHIVSLIAILIVGFIVVAISALFYHMLEATILNIPTGLLFLISAVGWALLVIVFILLILGLPAILVITAIKVYLSSLLPEAPLLVIVLAALITTAILATSIEFMNNKK